MTPNTAISRDQHISRFSTLPLARVVSEYGFVPIKCFQKSKDSGLKTITIENIENIRPLSKEILPSASDFLWLCGKWLNFPSISGWNGFMEQATVGEIYVKSKILCLPFINAPPSDYDTIYTSLHSVVEKCKALN